MPQPAPITSLERRLRDARPTVPPVPPDYVARTWAYVRGARAASPHWLWALGLSLALALGAAAGLALWWRLGGWQLSLARVVSLLSCGRQWASFIPWLAALSAIVMVSAAAETLLAGWWVRRVCRVRGCLRPVFRSKPAIGG